jgi:ATP-dependent DNA helicase RecQ
LRVERGRLAREQGVPPYIIFHDTTLIALAQRRPQTMADLVGVPGMGKTKIERYGAAFLAALAAADNADA